MKKRNTLSTLIIGLVFAVAGILTIIYHDAFLKVVVVCAGIVTAYNGITTFINISKWGLADTARTLAIIKSIATFVIGIVAVLAPVFAAETVFSAVMYILAVVLILSAGVSIENAVVIKRLDKNLPTGNLWLEAGISILIAIILFSSPKAILATAVKVIGGILIGIGVCTVIWAIKSDSEPEVVTFSE